MPPTIQEKLIIRKLEEEFSDSILDVVAFRDELTIIVKREDILGIMQFLRDDDELSFNFLADIAGVDYLAYEPYQAKDYGGRFAVVYQLLSHKTKARLRVKVHIPEDDPTIDSMSPLWKTADWLEREVYDMFGIKFNNHPDLRRILTPDGFESYPLRKDYPLKGKGERDNFPVVKRG